MWAACPSRIDEQEQAERKARERVDAQLTSPLPQLGEDQGGQKPQRETFHRATRFFREALSQTHSCLRKQRGQIPGDQVKVNSPEQIF